ncbi:MAG: hypothetical protein OEV42_02375 [Deltaproteobacteria bacterium]|nr:hypothetical protein [Deltaproteobacteria bacterium]
MASLSKTVEKNHKLIIIVETTIILAVLVSCTLHDIIPVCHYLFGCDHRMHAISAF